VPELRRSDRSNPVTTARPSTLGHLARSLHSKYLGPISIKLGSDESVTPCRGAGHFLRRYPEVAAPKPLATSGYPPATLLVDRSRMFKLQAPGRSRAFRPACSRESQDKPPASDLQAMNMGAFLYCSSIVPLLVL